MAFGEGGDGRCGGSGFDVDDWLGGGDGGCSVDGGVGGARGYKGAGEGAEEKGDEE